MKKRPIGPSNGMNVSVSPHTRRMGVDIRGSSFSGRGPGGPERIEQKAWRAPSSPAGRLMICTERDDGTMERANEMCTLYTQNCGWATRCSEDERMQTSKTTRETEKHPGKADNESGRR